ncbi:dethiobiotin synthase [Rhizobium freirei PRF 81]|uniref:ATP-dependent dethiobiotin synthetase BioD n=1 Tax=Rhizobium freirei PRF 81 TaxID=363754 RepID=N6UX30_9HYPH|nr:dethiobiotin synthase [Rhizobium freirei]ENN85311.1 dethiobiotin synthase [Rhizobium freirei PRF 81]
MRNSLVVTGTDTGIGKTVFSAALVDALGACYWKPVQSGLEDETDSETVAMLGQIPQQRILREAWRLRTPASPHLSAQIDGVAIDPDMLTPPPTPSLLVIEGAGGLLVPLTSKCTFADVFARWRYPVILCARTELGTINHTLLSLEAMRRREIPILGVAFIGNDRPDTMKIIGEMGGAPILGRLPHLDPLTSAALRAAFADHFDLSVFREVFA